MKRLLRSFVIHFVALWIVATFIGGISYGNNFQYLALAAGALMLADMLLRPLLNLLLLPFNLVTLGIFRWVSGVVTFYIATTLVKGFSIVPFTYPGLHTNLFIIPAISFSAFSAFIAVAFLVSFVTSVLFWISK